MFSSLAKGYASWTGQVGAQADWSGESDKKLTLPTLPQQQEQKHGVTSRVKSAFKGEGPNGEIILPKTYITRKGALILFTDQDGNEWSEDDQLRLQKIKKTFNKASVCDVSTSKFRTIDRLAKSVLVYGDESYEEETASITNEDNKIFLKFIQGLDEQGIDLRSQPGGDFNYYLRDVKAKALSQRSSTSQADQSEGLPRTGQQSAGSEYPHRIPQAPVEFASADWGIPWVAAGTDRLAEQYTRPISQASHRPPGEGAGSSLSGGKPYQVLSSEKLAASLKSGGYLGRHGSILVGRTDEGPQSQHSTSRAAAGGESRPPSPLESRSRSRPLSSRSHQSHRSQTLSGLPENDADDEGDGDQSTERGVHLRRHRRYMEERSDTDETVEGSEAMQSARKSRSGSKMGSALSRHGRSGFHDDMEEMYEYLEYSGLPGNLDLQEDGLRDSTLAQPLMPPYQGLNMFVGEGAGGMFSIGSTHPESQDLGEIIIEDPSVHVIPHIQSVRSSISGRGIMTPYHPHKEEDGADGSCGISRASSHASAATDRAKSAPASSLPASRQRTPASGPEGGIPDVSQAWAPEGVAEEEEGAQKAGISQGPSEGGEPQGSGDLPAESATGQDVSGDSQQGAAQAPPPEGSTQAGEGESIVSATTAKSGKSGKTEESAKGAVVEIPLQDGSLVSRRSSAVHSARGTTSRPASRGIGTPDLGTQTPAPQHIPTPPSSRGHPRYTSTPERRYSIPSGGPGTPIPLDSGGVVPLNTSFEQDTPFDFSHPTHTKLLTGLERTPSGNNTNFIDALDISSVLGNGMQNGHRYSVDTTEGTAEPSTPKTPGGSKKGGAKGKKDSKKGGKKPGWMKNDKKDGAGKAGKDADNLESELNEILDTAVSTHQYDEDEGMTAEELELEQQILKDKVEEAEKKLQEKDGKGKKKGKKEEAKGGKGKKGKKGKDDEKTKKEREAAKESKKKEKQKRMEEARALQEKIKAKKAEKQAMEDEAEKHQKQLETEMEALKAEEEEVKMQEEEARRALQQQRALAREEREKKRKAESERRKAETEKRRAEQRATQEAAKQRELEMLESISGVEARRKAAEEARLKREEEELLEQQRIEQEEEEERIRAEEEEERIAEMERQAEEEAMQRMIDEREEAERKKLELEEQAFRMAEEEERKRQEEAEEEERQRMLEEQRRLEEEARKREEEEEKRREEERKRLAELQRMEEEARERMRQEMEKRREAALRRREKNLESKAHLDKVRYNQGITRPWVFSYYVLWPRETYERPMGEDPKKKKKKGFRPPAKKKALEGGDGDDGDQMVSPSS